MSNYNVISKNELCAPVNGFPFYVSRLVVIEEGASRRVCVRAFNYGGVTVTGVRLRLRLLDAENNLISSRLVESDGLAAESGAEFAIPDIAVGKDCFYAEAQIELVRSGDYEYVPSGNMVSVRYSKYNGAEYIDNSVGSKMSPLSKTYGGRVAAAFTIFALTAALAALVAAFV